MIAMIGPFDLASLICIFQIYYSYLLSNFAAKIILFSQVFEAPQAYRELAMSFKGPLRVCLADLGSPK